MKKLFTKLKTDATAVLLIDTYNKMEFPNKENLFTKLMNEGDKNSLLLLVELMGTC